MTGYQIIVYDTTAGKSTSYTVGASVTRYSPGALSSGDKYVWNVRVLNGAQSGPPSRYLNFQTPAATGSTAGSAPLAVASGVPTSVLTPSLSGALPASTVTGRKVNIHQSITLTNTTGGVVHGSAKGMLYLSASPTLDSTSIPVMSSGPRVRLKAGKHLSFNVAFRKLPADVPNGVYYLVFQMTDPSGVTSLVSSAGTITVERPG